MKILYDHQKFSVQKYGGITKYFSEIISNFPLGHQYYLPLILSDNHYLKEKRQFFKKRNILPDRNFPKKEVVRKIIYSINGYYSRRCISANNFDIFHPTFYDDYFLKILRRPYVVTVHDLIEFRFKDRFFKQGSIRGQMERVIRNANRIIAISKNTKKDIIELFGTDPGRIDVIYHGFNRPINPPVKNLYGRYILYVGQRDKYKNFKTFSEAIRVLFSRERDLKLVCVGSPFNWEEVNDLKKLKIFDRTVILNASEDLLNSLYANALVFVFPSLYEGFGMPILEAFANECPVCLSDSSCFPEIAGNAGAYFDPNSYESILAAIENVIYNNDFALDIVRAGQNKLADFSWKKAALETLMTYQKAIFP